MFFDDFFIEGFTIGYCVSNLKTMVLLSEEDKDLEDFLKEKYPLITDNIKEEIKLIELKGNNNKEKDFFKKYETFFKSSDIYLEGEKQALYFLKRKQIEESLNYFFKDLKTIDLKENEDNYLIILLDTNYAKRKKSLIEDDSTIKRIELAKKLINIEETSISEIKELIKINELNNKEDYLFFRYKNYILEISSISKNDYILYKLYSIPKDKYWRIIKTNYGEKLEILTIDNFNRLI